MSNRSQHAYIKPKLIENALHDVTAFVEANLTRGEYTLSAFPDIEGSLIMLPLFLLRIHMYMPQIFWGGLSPTCWVID